MRQPLRLQRQPNGDLLLPAEAVHFLMGELRDLQNLLRHEHGLRFEKAGRVETREETAFRQDSVDQLSAAAGIKATTVESGSMAPTVHTVDHSGAADKLDQLCKWLEAGS